MPHIKKCLEVTEDRIIRFTIVFSVAIVACKNMMAGTLQLVNKLNHSLNVIIIALIAILFTYCLYNIGFRIKKKSLYILLVSTTFILVTYLFNHRLFTYHHISSGIQVFIAYCIPLLILVPLLKDTDKFINAFYTASYFMCIIAVFTFSLIILGFETIKEYSMSYGANTMIPCIFLFSKAFKEKSLKDYILAFVCATAIFAIGSRWPILCIGAFVFYGLYKKAFAVKKHRFIVIIIIIVVLCLTIISYKEIITGTDIFLEQLNIKSRTIRLLLSDRLIHDSGRAQIHQQLMEKLYEKPLLGYGAFGGVIALDGELAHSLPLDIWANFGFIIGSLLIIFSVYMTIQSYRYNKESSFSELIAIYACMVWPKALVGGSFWSLEPYWMLISLFILGSGMKVKIDKDGI